MRLFLPFSLLFFYTLCNAQNIDFRSKIHIPGPGMTGIWGYTDGTFEYALVGNNERLTIVNVTDPEAPEIVNKVEMPGGSSRDVRMYENVAYVGQIPKSSDSLFGIWIVDLNALPNDSLPAYLFTEYEAHGVQLKSAWHLEVDQKKGFLYLFHSNITGTLVYDLKPDPYRPTYVATYNQIVGHDAYIDNDTMYLAATTGLYIIDVSDKSNPITLGYDGYGSNGHNCWLSEDRKLLFMSSMSSPELRTFDVSDPLNPELLDMIKATPDSKNHMINVYAFGQHVIGALHMEGLAIINAERPDNLAVTGKYDTYPETDKLDLYGCYAIYPFLPSKNIIATNELNFDSSEIVILTPHYTEAAYLEGKIINASTFNPVAGATVELLGQPISSDLSNGNGLFKMALAESGTFDLRVSKQGYFPQIITVNLTLGNVQNLTVSLIPAPKLSFAGNTISATDGSPLEDIKIRIVGEYETIETYSLSDGTFEFPDLYAGHYDIYIGQWGYRFQYFEDYLIDGTAPLNLFIEKGYEDPFVQGFDFGWDINPLQSYIGGWVKAKPISNEVLGAPNAPETDVPQDIDDLCFITGNYDNYLGNYVKDSTWLRSPKMDLSNLNNPRISFDYSAFALETPGEPLTDSVFIYLNSGPGDQRIAAFPTHGGEWKNFSFYVADYVPLTPHTRFRIKAKKGVQGNSQSYFRVAFDNFKVEDETLSAHEPGISVSLLASPNPFVESCRIQFDNLAPGSRLLVYDLLGRVVESKTTAYRNGEISIGESLTPGVYMVTASSECGRNGVVRIIKTQ
ncbi:MAG: choice-of-anchor B family protein [Saprospiraceae bacterium]